MASISPEQAKIDLLRSNFTSSRNFSHKQQLPPFPILVKNGEIFLSEILPVRNYNGIFWKPYRLRHCILLQSGRFFIYSSSTHGLSLMLSEITMKQSDSKHTKKSTTSCKFVLYLEKKKLCIKVNESQGTAEKWKKGFILANIGRHLEDVDNTDAYFLSQYTLDTTLSPCAFNTIRSTHLDATKYATCVSSPLMVNYRNAVSTSSYVPPCNDHIDSEFDDPTHCENTIQTTDTTAFVTCHEAFEHHIISSSYLPGISQLTTATIQLNRLCNLSPSLESLKM